MNNHATQSERLCGPRMLASAILLAFCFYMSIIMLAAFS